MCSQVFDDHRDPRFRKMLKTKIVVGLVTATAVALSPHQRDVRNSAGGAQGRACSIPTISGQIAAELADSIEMLDGTHAADSERAGLNWLAAPVRLDDECLIAVALSWDGGLGGGLAIGLSTPKGMAWDYALPYPGASALRAPSSARLAFEFESIRSSNLLERRLIILCGLAPTLWAPCFDEIVQMRWNPSLNDSTKGRRPFVELETRYHFVGDTIVLRRRIRYQTARSPRISDRNLGIVKVVIP